MSTTSRIEISDESGLLTWDLPTEIGVELDKMPLELQEQVIVLAVNALEMYTRTLLGAFCTGVNAPDVLNLIRDDLALTVIKLQQRY